MYRCMEVMKAKLVLALVSLRMGTHFLVFSNGRESELKAVGKSSRWARIPLLRSAPLNWSAVQLTWHLTRLFLALILYCYFYI